MKGIFITLEGADGSGKTTQFGKIVDFFKNKNIPFITTREPGGEALGQKIREILLNTKEPVSDRCELFLYLADRAQHVDLIIKTALKEGKIVLCDRHTDSTLAYQGYARGLDIDRLKMLNNIATNGLKPDLTLLFDVDPNIAMQRVGTRANKDRLEQEGVDFHKKVRNGYLKLAQNEPERIKIIDANKSVNEVWEQVLPYLEKITKNKL